MGDWIVNHAELRPRRLPPGVLPVCTHPSAPAAAFFSAPFQPQMTTTSPPGPCHWRSSAGLPGASSAAGCVPLPACAMQGTHTRCPQLISPRAFTLQPLPHAGPMFRSFYYKSSVASMCTPTRAAAAPRRRVLAASAGADMCIDGCEQHDHVGSSGENEAWLVTKDLIAGTLGGVASIVAGQPLDTAKVRLQANPTAYKGFVQCLTSMIRTEGVRTRPPSNATTNAQTHTHTHASTCKHKRGNTDSTWRECASSPLCRVCLFACCFAAAVHFSRHDGSHCT